MPQTNFRAQIDEYTKRVLGVVKEKYGLRDKSEALNKFADMYGDQFVEKEVNEAFITETLNLIDAHHKKHPKRTMSIKELDIISGT